MRKIAEIKIKSLTPVSIGGHNPKKYDDAIIRTSSVRGILRWWARALVAGVAYDHGLDEIKVVPKIVNKVFGGVDDDAKSSLISLKIGISNIDDLSNDEAEFMWQNSPRIKLLTMGMNKNEAIGYIKNTFKKNISAKVYLYSLARKPYEYQENVALIASFLAFTLGGLGKGSRRGFGAFYIEDINEFDVSDSTHSLVNQLRRNLIRRNDSIQVVKDKLREIIRISREIISTKFDSGKPSKGIPKIHAITREKYFHIFIKNVNTLEITNILDALCFLQNLFLRNPKRLPQSIRSLSSYLQDAYGLHAARRLASYFEGLPRSAERKGIYRYVDKKLHQRLKMNNIPDNIDTGYKITYDRRASPIIASFINDHIIVLSVFLSSDWPDRLEWTSLHMINSRTKKPPSIKKRIFADEFALRRFNIDIKRGSISPISSIYHTLTGGHIRLPVPSVSTVYQAYNETIKYFNNNLKCKQVWP